MIILKLFSVIFFILLVSVSCTNDLIRRTNQECSKVCLHIEGGGQSTDFVRSRLQDVLLERLYHHSARTDKFRVSDICSESCLRLEVNTSKCILHEVIAKVQFETL